MKDLIQGLAGLPPFTVNSQEYTGSYFSLMLSINWECAAEEAERTPQLIYELGHLAAQAKAEHEALEVEYRVWRDSQVWQYVLGPDALTNAQAAGFAAAVEKQKVPAKTDVEIYYRSTPEYKEHWRRQRNAELAYNALYRAYEAAKARQSVLRNWDPETMNASARRDDLVTPEPPATTYNLNEVPLLEQEPPAAASLPPAPPIAAFRTTAVPAPPRGATVPPQPPAGPPPLVPAPPPAGVSRV